MWQVVQAVSFCHSKGLMHRNLKPDNILIEEDGSVKLSDFTLSRMGVQPDGAYTPEDPKERERSGREARRLWYRAPEMLFRKNTYAFEVDLWSVGCLLAELGLGEPLFCGETEVEQLFKIFKFTGSPSDELFMERIAVPTDHRIKLPMWRPQPFASAAAGPGSPDFQSLVEACLPGREETVSRLVALSQSLGAEGLDLLGRLLSLDPAERISASEALLHPYFSELAGPAVRDCHAIKEYSAALRWNEDRLRPNPEYMAGQPKINDSMRAVLIDWLIDVSNHFEVSTETLHFAISYIDRTLSCVEIEKQKLQLVGVTSMKIADVFNEKSKEYYRQENATEYAYITADEYSAQEVIEMEKKMLGLLEFNLFSPTVAHFLNLYL